MSIELLTQMILRSNSTSMWMRHGQDLYRPSVGFASIWLPAVAGNYMRSNQMTGFQLPPLYGNRNAKVARTQVEWETLSETDAILTLETRCYGPLDWNQTRLLRTGENRYESEESWLRFCREQGAMERGMETQYFLLRVLPPETGDGYTWDLVNNPSSDTSILVLSPLGNTSVTSSNIAHSASKKRPCMETLGMESYAFSVRISVQNDDGVTTLSKTVAYCVPIIGYDAYLAKNGNLTTERCNHMIENYPATYVRQQYRIPRIQEYNLPEIREDTVNIGHLAFHRTGEGEQLLIEDHTLHELVDWAPPYPIVSTEEPLELSFNKERQVTIEHENCEKCKIKAESQTLPAGNYIISPIEGCSHYYNLNDSNYRNNAQYNTRATIARLLMAIDVKAGSEEMVRFNVAKTERITKSTGFGVDDGLLDRLHF